MTANSQWCCTVTKQIIKQPDSPTHYKAQMKHSDALNMPIFPCGLLFLEYPYVWRYAHLYIHMYECTYVRMYVRTYVFMYVCMYVCMLVYLAVKFDIHIFKFSCRIKMFCRLISQTKKNFSCKFYLILYTMQWCLPDLPKHVACNIYKEYLICYGGL
jgi:hypothetical protein